ncbi:hypothetical protein EC988_007785, partial [Linderina pennispora]
RPQSAIVKHMSSAPALSIEMGELADEPIRSSRSSESRARAQILAETARRLELGASARSPSPITPSSMSTGRTLPCFPEEEECSSYEYQDSGASSRASPMPSYSSSVTSSRTFTNRNRPSSIFGDSPSPHNTSSGLISSPRNSTSTPSASQATLRPQSMMANSEASRTKVATHAASFDESQNASGKRSQGQRYSVAMSQNLSRRFQTRLTHDYEQRIYCLHSHYSDVIERLESRVRQESERADKLEADLSEQRQAVADMRLQNSQATDSMCMSKKLVEFVDSYQTEITRLTREATVAQEWVITMAELVIGPKKESQSWDDWLNQCLDTLKARREKQREE